MQPAIGLRQRTSQPRERTKQINKKGRVRIRSKPNTNHAAESRPIDDGQQQLIIIVLVLELGRCPSHIDSNNQHGLGNSRRHHRSTHQAHQAQDRPRGQATHVRGDEPDTVHGVARPLRQSRQVLLVSLPDALSHRDRVSFRLARGQVAPRRDL